MAKGAKGVSLTKSDMASPVKAGGGTIQKVLTIPYSEEER